MQCYVCMFHIANFFHDIIIMVKDLMTFLKEGLSIGDYKQSLMQSIGAILRKNNGL